MFHREAAGGIVYHVFNRANAGITLFEEPGDYQAFEDLLAEAHEQVPMRTLAYCIMPTHWHFVLWPEMDRALSGFMHWLGTTHAKRWHAFRGTTGSGHIYQGRFKSLPVESDRHFITVSRYVERNALSAGLVAAAEDWRWSSLHRRQNGDAKARALLSDGPLPWPPDWPAYVNTPLAQAELERLRLCIARGRPFGSEAWVDTTARTLGLEHTLRQGGRPRRLLR